MALKQRSDSATKALKQRSGSATKALKQRSGSASRMRRAQRRMIGLVAAVAIHLLAGLAILPVVQLDVRPDRGQRLDAAAPLVIVQLVRWRPAAAPQVESAPMPASAPKSKAVSLPEQPAPLDIALSEQEAPSPVPPSRPEDDDPLYRVPFRDAVAQADARLRAGLSCEHVDLAQLPKAVLDQCAAAAKFKGAA